MTWNKTDNLPPKSPGRPLGAKNILNRKFLQDLQEDYLEHGKGVIRICCIERPHEYLKLVAALLPREDKMDLDLTVRRIVTGVPRQAEAVEMKAVKELPPAETGVRVEVRHPGITDLDTHREPAQGLDPEEKKPTPVDYPDLKGWR
jgi:hypothetical protein